MLRDAIRFLKVETSVSELEIEIVAVVGLESLWLSSSSSSSSSFDLCVNE